MTGQSYPAFEQLRFALLIRRFVGKINLFNDSILICPTENVNKV